MFLKLLKMLIDVNLVKFTYLINNFSVCMQVVSILHSQFHLLLLVSFFYKIFVLIIVCVCLWIQVGTYKNAISTVGQKSLGIIF